jgi:hypothetical protein
MQHTLARETPAILIDVVASVLCFVLGAGWWKFTGRDFDRDTAMFWAKKYAPAMRFRNRYGLHDVISANGAASYQPRAKP